MEASRRTGVDPRIIVAQSALETGYGKSAPGNNYFGIKSHGQPGGQTLPTTEIAAGQPIRINDSFRTYDSPEASAKGYADFLLNNPRYKPLMAAQGLDNQLRELQASGYATDPQYAAKVGQIARSIDGKKTAARTSASAQARTGQARTGQASAQRQGQLFPDRLMQILLSPYVDAPTKGLFVNEFQRKSTPAQMTDFQRQWQLFQQNPEAYERFRAAGRKPGTNVTVNTGKKRQQYPGLSKAPTGYSYVYDNKGELVMENNLPVLRALPGGPQAQKEQQQTTQRERQRQSKEERNAVVLEDIDQALKAIQSPGFPSTGIFGQILGDVGGTNAHDLSTTLDSIRANIGFDQLQKMREASPTGGALGQVTERELAFLQSVLGSLTSSQNEEKLIFNLNRLKRLFSETDLLDRMQDTLANPPKPDNVQQRDWDYMTPAERRQYYSSESN